MNAFKAACRTCEAPITMDQDSTTKKWRPCDEREGELVRHVCGLGARFETLCRRCGAAIAMLKVDASTWVPVEWMSDVRHECGRKPIEPQKVARKVRRRRRKDPTTARMLAEAAGFDALVIHTARMGPDDFLDDVPWSEEA